MILKKNQEIELDIESLSSMGSGVGHFEGMAVFVYGAVPGDRISAHIIKVSKSYAIGKANRIITPSKHRIQSDCPVSQSCGGCAFRNMTYDAEKQYKLERVNDAVKRIGHLDIRATEILSAKNIGRYRNKAQYPVSITNGELTAGFYANKSHRIISCDDCLLAPEEFEKGIEVFRLWVKKENITSYDSKTKQGLLRHIYFRKAFGTGEIMATAVINGDDIPNRDFLITALKEKIENIKSISININKENTNVILGRETVTIWGSDTICDELLDKKYVISPNSFYQVNHDACEMLYSKVIEFANLNEDETLLDLYCGAGTIGLSLADKAKKVIGVEVIPSAVENAKNNANINNIKNAVFICADAAKAADLLTQSNEKIDVVVVDPPRKGCDSTVFDAVNKMDAKRIVYVSCDPATLARDMEILSNMGFAPQKMTTIDLFPRTTHVESVVLLTK